MSPIASFDRELRVAPVMTGGTSLSVWMGGATVELYRMLRAADGAGVYGRLLNVTRTRCVVDVITGTSAGGLNGAILASALAWGVPVSELEGLREVWMESADLDRLLWDEGSTPAALLDGNKAFVPPVFKKLEGWASSASERRSEWREVDLVTTFTAVHPRRRTVVDDFGERLDEEVFAGTIRHQPKHFVSARDDSEAADQVAQRDLPGLLAWGARASASIPGVFEPVFLPRHRQPVQPPDWPRPGFGDRITVGGRPLAGDGVWAVDGGLVNNLPLEDALDRIFARRSVVPVRRVVLYVSPTPTDVKEPADTDGEHPSLIKSVLTIVTAARAEGVSDSIETVRDHNRTVSRQRTARTALALIDPTDKLHETDRDDELFAQYRRRRAEESVARTLKDLDEHLAVAGPQRQPRRRTSIAGELLVARMSEGLLPWHLPSPEEVGQQPWAWGITPIEQAISTVIGLVNRTLSLPLRVDSSDEQAVTAMGELELTKAAAHDVLAQVDALRSRDRSYWSSALPQLIAREDNVTELASALYEAWPGEDRDSVLSELRQLMIDIGAALARAEPHLTLLLGRAGAGAGAGTASGDDDGRPPRTSETARLQLREEAESLHRELRTVAYPAVDQGTTGPAADWCAVLLLRSHVLQTLLFGETESREQPVEVMQLSWNSVDQLTHREPAQKLCGTEFARLGAFVLPSWRANDFFWGEMDAAPRLIALLADPRRLVQLGSSPSEILDALGLESGAVNRATRTQLEGELDFLARGGGPIPDELPLLVTELTRRRQVEIARVGLPEVHAALKSSKEAGASMEPARQFLDDYRMAGDPENWDDETVVALLHSMRIGEETMEDQLRSDLVERFVSEAAEILGRALEPLKVGEYAKSHTWVAGAVTLVQWLTKPDVVVKKIFGSLRGRD